MSKYVNKPHGLVIGSDNFFTYRDEEDKFHNFNAIVWAQNAYFPNHSSAHAGIRTLANQFIWDEWDETRDSQPFEYEGEMITVKQFVVMRSLRPYIKYWLDQNAPGWGVRPPGCPDPNPAIFFQLRKHALAFTKMVDEQLRGWSFI